MTTSPIKYSVLLSSFHSLNNMHKALLISVIRGLTASLIVCSCLIKGLSQENNIGIPQVFNYTKDDYAGGTQNWEGFYLKSGKILFANNEGLLIFNGNEWKLLSTPKKTIIRSLEVTHDNSRFWVGGQDEIGYFQMVNGSFEFVDQKYLIPEEHRSLDDVWEIVSTQENEVYFRSRNKIFRIYNEEVEVYPTSSFITFLRELDETIYSNDGDLGLVEFKNGIKEVVKNGEIFINRSVIDVIKLDSTKILIVSYADGLYELSNGQITPFKTNAEEFLNKYNVNSAHYLKKSKKIVLGTEAGGLIAIDLEGNSQFIINKKYGLQNNTVASITSDANENLWVGTYNGIDKIDLASSAALVYPDGDLEGAVYDIKEWKDAYYFATSNGLFKTQKRAYYDPMEQDMFEKIKNTDGQAWGLSIVDNQLMLGHTNGAYQINEDGTAIGLYGNAGTWKFVQMDASTLIRGTYGGLELFKKENDNWVYKKNYQEFFESSRIMFKDIKGFLWVSHPYKGLFRMRFSEEYENMEVDTIDHRFGLNDLTDCYVHSVEGVPLVSVKDDLYMFDYKQEKFLPSEEMNNFFAGQKFKRFFDTDKGLWYITDKEAGLMLKNISGLSTTLEKKTYLKGKSPFVAGFEYLFPLSNSEALLATDKGVLHSVFDDKSVVEPTVRINSISISGEIQDSIIYQGYVDLPRETEIDFEYHDVRFDFISDRMETDDLNMRYSYKLEGSDKQWSEWSGLRFKEYTNLPADNYTFKVKCSTYENPNAPETQYFFEVLHPWYSTWIMKLIYVLLGLAALFMLVLIPNRKIKKEKEIIEIQKKETEAIVENLENESLQNEIKFQNRELANLTMHLLQKSETLKQIKSEVENVRKKIKDPDAKKEIRKVVSLLNSDIRLEEDWNNFSYHFDKVHHDFLKKIQTEYPKLTANDLKLCAYLRLNLSTKEIAPLLNISTRGVEISRYRLRKKLALSSDINLNSFMLQF